MPRRAPAPNEPGSALAARLRAARAARRLSQAGLAAASGVSRITIARIESGAAVDPKRGTLRRLSDTLAVALDPHFGAGREDERRAARAAERARRLDARRRHAALAARLCAMSSRDARAAIGRARAVVERWARDELCSVHYVSRWRAMLVGPPKRVALSLLDYGAWTDALFQNSPWISELDPPAA